jgi:hypothetical protein
MKKIVDRKREEFERKMLEKGESQMILLRL